MQQASRTEIRCNAHQEGAINNVIGICKYVDNKTSNYCTAFIAIGHRTQQWPNVSCKQIRRKELYLVLCH